MKYLRSIIIIVLLFGLPLGSWYFLKHGFNWRKSKIEQLQAKENLLNDIKWDNKQKDVLRSILHNKTTVIDLDNDQDDKERIIMDQYRKARGFQWLNIDSNEQMSALDNTHRKEYLFFTDNESFIKTKLNNARYALLDTGMYVRQTYPDNSELSLSQLVEDISLILPRPKEKDISIRKKSN